MRAKALANLWRWVIAERIRSSAVYRERWLVALGGRGEGLLWVALYPC